MIKVYNYIVANELATPKNKKDPQKISFCCRNAVAILSNKIARPQDDDFVLQSYFYHYGAAAFAALNKPDLALDCFQKAIAALNGIENLAEKTPRLLSLESNLYSCSQLYYPFNKSIAGKFLLLSRRALECIPVQCRTGEINKKLEQFQQEESEYYARVATNRFNSASASASASGSGSGANSSTATTATVPAANAGLATAAATIDKTNASKAVDEKQLHTMS